MLVNNDFPTGETYTPLVHAHAGRTQGQSEDVAKRCSLSRTLGTIIIK